jgi:phenylalanyl-tRNA synthetase alpha chain
MQRIAEVEEKAVAAISAAASTDELKLLDQQYLGKKGELTGLMRLIGTLPPEDKPQFGGAVNKAKARLQGVLDARVESLKGGERAAQYEKERIDVTLPGLTPQAGREHVLQLAINRIHAVLGTMGFEYAEGPELEDFKYNFDWLNYPEDHPAMDEQDTFYITDDTLLRTQGTAVQGRVFEIEKPPLRHYSIGRTFRNETVDRTHAHTFFQVDCFMVDEGVSMAHLKGTLDTLASAMFGDEAKVRFRPDFFPFVEPGVDYAISTPKLFGGKWVELGGAGMIHPNILRRAGIDTEKYSGFAFGLGVERIPMMAWGIDDLRNFLENDQRFLEQFG